MIRKWKLLVAVLLVGLAGANAQSLKKYPVGNSGCFYYGFCEAKLNLSYSPDSSKLWTGGCGVDALVYDLICVQLKERISDLPVAEDVLIQYLNFLKQQLGVKEAAGYGKGHRLQGSEETRGVIDYWKYDTGENVKVKGWIDGRFIAVMLVSSKGEIPVNKSEVYLDGFRFPEK
jgi:hypothetical protein